MTFEQRKRKQLLASCEELRDDDGVDPRTFFRPTRDRGQQHRKNGQLCRQVAETLSLVLAGEFDDARLHNLQVISVEPAPDASQLLVTVAFDGTLDHAAVAAIQARLARVAGRLRFEVAAAITRKRAPRLTFRVIGTASDEVQP